MTFWNVLSGESSSNGPGPIIQHNGRVVQRVGHVMLGIDRRLSSRHVIGEKLVSSASNYNRLQVPQLTFCHPSTLAPNRGVFTQMEGCNVRRQGRSRLCRNLQMWNNETCVQNIPSMPLQNRFDGGLCSLIVVPRLPWRIVLVFKSRRVRQRCDVRAHHWRSAEAHVCGTPSKQQGACNTGHF